MNDPRFRGLVPIYAPGKEPLPPGITEDDRATYMQAMKYQALAGAAMESCAAKATIAAVGGTPADFSLYEKSNPHQVSPSEAFSRS